MPMFITLGKLTEKGIENIRSWPEGVRVAIARAEQQGIKVHGYYVTEGQYDIVAIVEVPDEQTGLIGLLGNLSAGYVRTETLRAHTLDEVDQAIDKMG